MVDRLHSLTSALVVASVLVASSVPAHAIPLVFSCVAVGNAKNCGVGEAQLLVEVEDFGDDQVAFIFSNDGEVSSSIARIYVADDRGTLSAGPSILNEVPTVAFEVGVTPKDLPGGSSAEPPFVTVPDLCISAVSPYHEMGVNPGEHIAVLYTLAPGRTMDDIIADLSIGYLRFGVNVVGFPSAGSESFVSQVLLTEVLE